MGNSISRFDLEIVTAKVVQNNFDFFSVKMIDGTVMSDNSPAGQSASTANASLPALLELHAPSQRNQSGLSVFDHESLGRTQIKARVRGVSPRGQLSLGRVEFDHNVKFGELVHGLRSMESVEKSPARPRGLHSLGHQANRMSQTVLISGASRGLGAETAIAAAQLGANLILTARSEEGLKDTSERIEKTGHQGTVTLVPGDLSQKSFCHELTQKATQTGPLHAAILNAAQIEPIGAVEDVDEDEWLRCVQVNLSAPFLMAKYLLPALGESQGRLITIGTGAATSPISSWSAYCSSKAALLMLIRVIAVEKPDVTAFSFAPGVVNTAMQQNIRDRKEMMPAQLAEYFSGLHSNGQLEPPEVPGRALAWCALNAPSEWTGQEVIYSDPGLVQQVRAAFG